MIEYKDNDRLREEIIKDIKKSIDAMIDNFSDSIDLLKDKSLNRYVYLEELERIKRDIGPLDKASFDLYIKIKDFRDKLNAS